jgi:hypothetical protein
VATLKDVMAIRRLILAIALAGTASHWLSFGAPTAVLDSLPRRSNLQEMDKRPVPRYGYVGDEICGSCHRDKIELFFRTAHHLTSRQASADSIAGPFGPGVNTLTTSNPALSFRMDARAGRFYETAIWGIPPSTTEETASIDLVIGSGRKGQSYLYWKDNRLFQLPVSYWLEPDRWVNSPGYTDGDADFDRPVMSRCLECHASYAESLAGPLNNRYKKSSLVLGISCERCHGPGREHVSRHQSASADIFTEAIVNPSKLTRERDVEVCAQCHAGMRWPTAPAYSYVPGEPLDEYLGADRSDPNATIDVHGGHVGLLKRSRCYQASTTLTCSTCHKVHESQRDAAAFSARCLTCHKMENCGTFGKMGAKIATGCIDCHMPIQQSKAISSDSEGRQIKAPVRNHWIKVYSNIGM